MYTSILSIASGRCIAFIASDLDGVSSVSFLLPQGSFVTAVLESKACGSVQDAVFGAEVSSSPNMGLITNSDSHSEI